MVWCFGSPLIQASERCATLSSNRKRKENRKTMKKILILISIVIIVTSLHRDYLPSSWVYYSPTWVEVGIFVGSIGVFMTLFLLFCRFFPAIAIAEVKSILKVSGNQYRQKQLDEVKEQEVYKNISVEAGTWD